MSFGEKLRNAIEGFRRSTFSDKDSIKESVKEIQRALISADVEISLVFELSKKIESEVFRELPKGLTRREHAIKATYDLLVELLGGEKKQFPEKTRKILLCGLFGSGKCVHPDTVIPLKNGEIERIEELYQKQNDSELVVEDGFVKTLSKPIPIFSFDPITLKMVSGKATHIWKLKKTEPLIKVHLDNGNNHAITVTPEHPFFVLENGEIKKVLAANLRLEQFVSTPKKIDFDFGESLENVLIEKLGNGWIIENNILAKNAKEFITKKFGNLTEFFNQAGESYRFCTFCGYLKKGKMFVSMLRKLEKIGFKIELSGIARIAAAKSAGRMISVPLSLDEDFCEFLGYFYADGHMRRQYVEVCNESDEVIERLRVLGKKLFGLTPRIKKDKRRVSLRSVLFCSTNLSKFLNEFFGVPFNKKSDKIFMPKYVLTANSNAKKFFLRAYFDCDGSIGKNMRAIEFCTASKNFAEGLRCLLLDFGFVPSYSIKTFKEKKYYRLHVKAKDAEMFANEVGSIIPFKKERLAKCVEIGVGQSFGKQEMLHLGRKLKEIREFYGTTIGEVQKHVSSYGIYEAEGLISRNSFRTFLKCVEKTKNKNNELLQIFIEPKTVKEITTEINETSGWINAVLYRMEQQGFLELFNGLIQITKKGKELLEKNYQFNQMEIQNMKTLSESDIAWIKVKKLETVENTEFVYDLTVENYHNFVANQTIIHNTTSCGKLGKFFSKRGKSVGVICADTFRPAAFEQLKQLCDKAHIDFFGILEEKNAAKVVFEGLKKFKEKDLIIVDSAGRNALDEELVKEIKEIVNVFQPDSSLLVLGADVGQIAKKQAQAFHEAVGVNGVILTRMDGSAKGGGALAACHVTKSPVYFIGVGEKLEDFEEFFAERFLSRVMGYGDLQALLEKAKEISEEEELSPEELLQSEFNFKTFYQQLKAAKKMGPLGKVAEMMGMKMQLQKEQLEIGEEKLNKFGFIIDSMTEKERMNPELLNSKRIQRICRGSGTKESEVRELIKQFRQMEKMFKSFKKIGSEKELEKIGKSGDFSKIFQKIGIRQKRKKFKIR